MPPSQHLLPQPLLRLSLLVNLSPRPPLLLPLLMEATTL